MGCGCDKRAGKVLDGFDWAAEKVRIASDERLQLRMHERLRAYLERTAKRATTDGKPEDPGGGVYG